MQLPLQITFRDVDPTPALEDTIRGQAADLDKFCDDIMSCRVVFEAPHRRHRTGQLYHCRIDITVPGAELIVNRNPDQHGAHEDAYVAIRDAFRAARRELQDYVRRRRRDVKVNVGPPHALVTRLFPNEDCGFLTAGDGHEVYFHRNSVTTDFDGLSIGDEVRYAEEMGDKGPQATTVTLVGKSGHALA